MRHRYLLFLSIVLIAGFAFVRATQAADLGQTCQFSENGGSDCDMSKGLFCSSTQGICVECDDSTPCGFGQTCDAQSHSCKAAPTGPGGTASGSAPVPTPPDQGNGLPGSTQCTGTFDLDCLFNVTDIPTFIKNIYTYSLSIVGILIFLQFLRAGFMMLTAFGNTGKWGNAREMMTNAVIGALLLFSAVLILNVINPDLVSNSFTFGFGTPGSGAANNGNQPTNGGSTSTSGSGKSANAGTCQDNIRDDTCSPTALQSTCFGSNATIASHVCNKESGGDPDLPSGADLCKDGNIFSFGLFQINIIANGQIIGGPCANSGAIFNLNPIHGHPEGGWVSLKDSKGRDIKRRDCSVKNSDLYGECKNYILQKVNNINTACKLSSNGSNWQAWMNECSK